MMTEGGKLKYSATPLRHDPAYSTWIWGGIHPFLTTTVVPVAVILLLNLKVYR